MTLPIQRVPQGLSALLSTFGGRTPQQLGEEVRAVLELLQMYGLQQRSQLSFNVAAAAEGSSAAAVTLPAFWCVLFGAEFQVVKTATQTALRASISLLRAGQFSMCVASEELGPFGATETGTARIPWWAPYPILCPPNTVVIGRPDIIGTDANANVTISAEFGILG
jgi:hypothetical protein